MADKEAATREAEREAVQRKETAARSELEALQRQRLARIEQCVPATCN